MKITLEVNENENLVPAYYGYTGGFAKITKCSDCGRTGLYEDQHPVHPCNNCGGGIQEIGAGKFQDGKWLLRK